MDKYTMKFSGGNQEHDFYLCSDVDPLRQTVLEEVSLVLSMALRAHNYQTANAMVQEVLKAIA